MWLTNCIQTVGLISLDRGKDKKNWTALYPSVSLSHSRRQKERNRQKNPEAYLKSYLPPPPRSKQVRNLELQISEEEEEEEESVEEEEEEEEKRE